MSIQPRRWRILCDECGGAYGSATPIDPHLSEGQVLDILAEDGWGVQATRGPTDWCSCHGIQITHCPECRAKNKDTYLKALGNGRYLTLDEAEQDKP
jgi:hypothetical protein